ncbi:hypothetical protein SGPA1_10727 [Streptomyces misionensis JCM 4497]
MLTEPDRGFSLTQPPRGFPHWEPRVPGPSVMGVPLARAQGVGPATCVHNPRPCEPPPVQPTEETHVRAQTCQTDRRDRAGRRRRGGDRAARRPHGERGSPAHRRRYGDHHGRLSVRRADHGRGRQPVLRRHPGGRQEGGDGRALHGRRDHRQCPRRRRPNQARRHRRHGEPGRQDLGEPGLPGRHPGRRRGRADPLDGDAVQAGVVRLLHPDERVRGRHHGPDPRLGHDLGERQLRQPAADRDRAGRVRRGLPFLLRIGLRAVRHGVRRIQLRRRRHLPGRQRRSPAHRGRPGRDHFLGRGVRGGGLPGCLHPADHLLGPGDRTGRLVTRKDSRAPLG